MSKVTVVGRVWASIDDAVRYCTAEGFEADKMYCQKCRHEWTSIRHPGSVLDEQCPKCFNQSGSKTG